MDLVSVGLSQHGIGGGVFRDSSTVKVGDGTIGVFNLSIDGNGILRVSTSSIGGDSKLGTLYTSLGVDGLLLI